MAVATAVVIGPTPTDGREATGDAWRKVVCHDEVHSVAGDGDIPVYGFRPPLTKIQEIPQNFVTAARFTEDGAEMYDQFDETKRYTSVAVRRRDLHRKIKEIGNA